MPTDPDALAPRLPSPLQEAAEPRLAARDIRLLLKRDDLIHPAIAGNKWRKLAPNLRAAHAAGHHTLLTFGGAYSNHLRATAAAGRLLGFRTLGVVRGDELAARPLNPLLAACAADGMELHFVSRAAYRRRAEATTAAQLHARFGEFLLLPEGGSNAAAVQGCTELGAELRCATDTHADADASSAGPATEAVDTVAVACGTGGTLAGLAAGLAPDQRALGVAVLRGGFLGTETARLQRTAFGEERGDWHVEERFHCGGYARSTPELDAYAAEFEERNGLRLERTYVAKLLLALAHLAGEGTLAPGSTVAAVVTGRPAET